MGRKSAHVASLNFLVSLSSSCALHVALSGVSWYKSARETVEFCEVMYLFPLVFVYYNIIILVT